MTPEGRDSTPADVPEESRSSSSSGKKRKQLPLWQETILLLVVALALAIAIKALFVQAFYIPTQSMEPGFVKNDRILVEKPSYWTGDGPERGDIIVFKDPGGWLGDEAAQPPNKLAALMTKIGLYPEGGHLVKRVIGVAGDTISCCDKQGRLLVNGQPLNEDSYVAKEPGVPCRGPMIGCEWETGPVPDGTVFVMGDNRAHSADSSVHIATGDQYVPVDLVVGKVFVLLWPRDHFRFISRPDSFADVPDPS